MAAHHHHHPPLHSLLHPHLHAVLHTAAEHGFPSPIWTATQPDEKRSLSSDKTITPGSSLKTLKATPSENTNSAADSPASSSPSSQLSSSPSKLSTEPMFSSPISDNHRTQSSLVPASSSSSSNAANSSKRREATLDPFARRRDQQQHQAHSRSHSQQHHQHKTENELWIEVADALRVVADALREEDHRAVLGEDHFITHVLTFLALSITHPGSCTDGDKQQEADAATAAAAASSSQHKRSPSADLAVSRAISSRLRGVVLAQTQCLRIMANLCIDNDENRSKLLAHDAPLFVLRLVKDTLAARGNDDDDDVFTDAVAVPFDDVTLMLLKTAMGALLNLQLEHAPSRRWLLRLHKPHRLSKSREDDGEVSDDEEGKPVGVAAKHLHSSTSTQQQPHSPFELGEHEAMQLLFATATDERVYTPARWASDPTQAELGAEVASWAARVVDDLIAFETEEAQAALQDGEEVSEPAMLASPWKIALASDKATWQRLVRVVGAFVPGKAAHGAREGGEDEDVDYSAFIDADLALLALSGELFERLSHVGKGNHAAARSFKTNGLVHLDALLNFIDEGTSPAFPDAAVDPDDADSLAKEVTRAKSNAVKAAVAMAGEDSNMATLFGTRGDSSFLKRMKTWLARAGERDDLTSCALLSIANLARSDENCVALVEQGGDLVPLIVDLLRRSNGSGGAGTSGGASSMLLAHAALGLLKNLSVSPSNKALLGSTPGLIDEALPPFLAEDRDHAQPIQFAVVGILKQLAFSPAGGVEQGAVKVCGRLSDLLALIARSKDEPTVLEATRVLVNLIRTLWSHQASSGGESTDVEGAKRAVQEDGRVVEALAGMIRRSSKYPVLINESLVGLTVLATAGGEGARKQADTICEALLGSYAPSPRRSNADGPPKRSSTLDSTATATSPGAPADTPADVLYDVLSRPSSETRMPVQFAQNGCTLLTTLAAVTRGVEQDKGQVSEAMQSLAIKMLPALRAMKAREASASPAVGPSVERAIEVCEKAAF